jgi:putative transcriptional regulator
MTSARHHPPDELLLAYATGNIDPGHSLLVATHLQLCPVCRGDVAGFEDLCGRLLETQEPVPFLAPPLDPDTAPVPADAAVVSAVREPPPPGGFRLPQPLRSVVGDDPDALAWSWLGGRLRQHRIHLPGGNGVQVRLLRIDGGGSLPLHTHEGDELTLVLEGSYFDRTGIYQTGDVQLGDDDILHKPRVAPGESCLCLSVSCGPIQMTRWPWRMLNPLLRL